MDSLTHQAMLQSGAGSLYNQSSFFDPNAPLNKLEAAAVQIYCARIIANTPSDGVVDSIYTAVHEAKQLLQACHH
jgi:hypothetical protein